MINEGGYKLNCNIDYDSIFPKKPSLKLRPIKKL